MCYYLQQLTVVKKAPLAKFTIYKIIKVPRTIPPFLRYMYSGLTVARDPLLHPPLITTGVFGWEEENTTTDWPRCSLIQAQANGMSEVPSVEQGTIPELYMPIYPTKTLCTHCNYRYDHTSPMLLPPRAMPTQLKLWIHCIYRYDHTPPSLTNHTFTDFNTTAVNRGW